MSLLMWVFLQLDAFEHWFLLLLLSLVLHLNKLVFSLGEGYGQNVGGCVFTEPVVKDYIQDTISRSFSGV